jgi:hypothetical protein
VQAVTSQSGAFQVVALRPSERSDHVDHLGLADTVATTDEDRKTRIENGGDGGKEGSKVESHVILR